MCALLGFCLPKIIFILLKIKKYELGELRKTPERAQAEQEAQQRQLTDLKAAAEPGGRTWRHTGLSWRRHVRT